jgi:serine/threonine protein kinase
VVEAAPLADHDDILGAAQYTAPEYFLGESGSPRSDLFSLGVIAYQMLTGRLPYGAEVAKTRTRAQQRKLCDLSALDDSRAIPAWIDETLRKAVHPDPRQRYEELSEFIFDLRHPNQDFITAPGAPIMERNPLLFWKSLSAILAVVISLLVALQYGR